MNKLVLRKLSEEDKDIIREHNLCCEDGDFDKVEHLNRNQLYKQAGNSIVVQVLESIFKELLKGKNGR